MRRVALALCALVLVWVWPLWAQIDIADIFRRSQEADDRNALVERNYVFEQRRENRTVDAEGKVKNREVETFEIILSGGRPYRRLIARNDAPLSPAEERKEEAKQKKEVEDRARETPQQRERAIAVEEARRRRNRELAHDALNAFQFRLIDEDDATWIFEATPRPGFQPRTRETAVLKHFRGRIWISKKDYIWTKLDAEAMDDISFGMIVVRLDKGAHVVVERTHINDEVWLPKLIAGSGEARIALIRKMRMEFETTSSKFRRFSADSRLVADPVK
jgi:hypothetical protein